jgi:hypothetical protein
MNWKTTLALLVLVAAGGLLLWQGPQLPSWLDPTPRAPTVDDAGTRAALNELDADRILRIAVRRGGAEPYYLERAGDGWSLRGNWPARPAAARDLVQTVAGLRSRFKPEAARSEQELAAYGLSRPAAVIDLKTTGRDYHMEFGEGIGDSDRFARPTFLRLDGRDEVVRLGPGVVARLDRPEDYYQQRRLFPGERVAKDADSTERVEHLRARAVTVDRIADKKGKQDPQKSTETKPAEEHFRVVRKGDRWELAEPARDRLDARTRDALLAAVPDVWAENFVRVDPAAMAALVSLGAIEANAGAAAAAAFWATPAGLLVKAGLDAPEQTLAVTRNDGKTVTLRIGRASAPRARKVLRPPPPNLPPGVPAREREEIVLDEYRYAKLADNDQVFEIKADGLKDVFVPLDTLREASVASFSPADARRVEVVRGKKRIGLTKDKERWRLAEPVQADADSAKVTDLLSKLSGLQARDKDIIDNADPKKYGIDKDSPEVIVTVEEETKDKDAKGDKRKKTRTLAVRLGKHDAAAKKLYVMADDWPRINAVDDSLEALVRRPAVAYRGKRVLDFAAAELAKLEVRRGAEKYTLERAKDGWRLSSPVSAEADEPKVDQLASTLGSFEVLEFVGDAPKAEDLQAQYGLGNPGLAVRLEFTDQAKSARTLEIGKARSDKGGYFARLADPADKTTPVFVVGKEVHEALDRDSLAYRQGHLWQLAADDVTGLRIRRDKQEYRLARDGSQWKISGPFEAPALAATAHTLANDFAAPRAQSCKAHEAKDLAPYGLDKPHLAVTVTGRDGKEHTLLVGAPAVKEASGRYAKLASGAAVFVVADSLARAADYPALDLLDPVLLHGATRIERVQSKHGDTSLTLQRKDEGWQVAEGPGAPFAADADAVASLEGAYANLRAERFAAYGPAVDWKKYGLDRPAVTVTVSGKPGDKAAAHTIELGGSVEGSPGARYARVDKGAGVAVLGSATAAVLDRTNLDYANRRLLHFDAAAAHALRRTDGADVLEVVKKDDSWRLLKPADEKADDKVIQALLSQLGELRARRIAAYPLKDPGAYGLDRPVEVKVQVAGGKPAEHVIKIGKPVAGTSGERYAQVDGGPAAAVLPAALADRLTAGAIAFRDRNLLHFADADRAALERGPRKAVFSRVEGTWKLTEPFEAPAENEELDDFVNALAHLRADALVAEKLGPGGLRKYGLDRPEARWHLASSGKEVLDLVIGKSEEHGSRRYARLGGKDLVFLLDAGLSARTLGEFRTRAVWNPEPDASQVESLQYGWSRNPFTLIKDEGGSWQAAGKPGVKINTDAVSDTLAALAKLKLARYVVDKGADLKLYGLDKPELVLEISTRSGKRALEVGSLAEGTKARYARVPGSDRNDVFVLDDADCARILHDLAGFRRSPPSASAIPSPLGR